MTATTSKYAHQSAATTTTPRTAAEMMPAESEKPAAPTPSEMIDSPSAMMTMSPYRSAKCAGEMCHPRPRPIRAPP
jgi:hypothetical protein